MRALDYWKAVTMDRANLLERLLAILDDHGIQYCVIGGQAVNAYVEPLVSLDLDLAVAADQLARVEKLLGERFTLKRHAHSLNVSTPGSDLRVQLQTDPRYAAFVSRAEKRAVLGLVVPVAGIEDVLQGKTWAALDVEQRGSKRQKDYADIARILEAYPHLQGRVPGEILARLV
jgi:hypothetical protein